MNDVVARFAPSPTGYLHIGGIRTALLNYILVQQAKLTNKNSKFLLRIEDTDKIRSNDQYKKSIIDGLKWLGLNWDDNIVIQSERINNHQIIAEKLLNEGYAYKCSCTSEKLEKQRLINKSNNLNVKRLCTECENDSKTQSLTQNYCIRIKIPNEGQIIVKDKIQGNVAIQNKEIDNFILLRENKTPTYMLSVVVDDHEMKINTIIRGNDHFNNTYKQMYIYKYLNWKIPQYAHLPLIHGTDGSKLSKRHGAIDINEFKKNGYLPISIINNLILLGWSPKKNNEIIDLNEIIEKFNIEEISNSASIFNYEKLNFFNNYYINNKENFSTFELYLEDNKILKEFYKKDKDILKKIYNVYKNKINKYIDLENIMKIYLYPDLKIDFKNFHIEQNFDIILKDFLNDLKILENWNFNDLENTLKNFIKINKIKFPLFGKPLRIILTNSADGPSITDILFLLGKKNTFLRINNYINREN